MYRWGDLESHSYPLGAYTTKAKAKNAGRKEREYRGGKYEPEVAQCDLDSKCNPVIVWSVEDSLKH